MIIGIRVRSHRRATAAVLVEDLGAAEVGRDAVVLPAGVLHPRVDVVVIGEAGAVLVLQVAAEVAVLILCRRVHLGAAARVVTTAGGRSVLGLGRQARMTKMEMIM